MSTKVDCLKKLILHIRGKDKTEEIKGTTTCEMLDMLAAALSADDCVLENVVEFEDKNPFIMYNICIGNENPTPKGNYRIRTDHVGLSAYLTFCDAQGNTLHRFDIGGRFLTRVSVLSTDARFVMCETSDGKVFELSATPNGDFSLKQLTYSVFDVDQLFLKKALPAVSTSDNGKTLQVVNGEWKVV